MESNKALAEIAGIRDRELRAGGVDSERDDFEMIIEAVRSGTMTPHAGVVQARTLASRRQDYH